MILMGPFQREILYESNFKVFVQFFSVNKFKFPIITVKREATPKYSHSDYV